MPARGAWRVGLDNYGLFPLGLSPLDTLEWALAHRADGVSFSGLAPEWQGRLDASSLEAIRAFAIEHGLYLEWGGAQHIPRDMTSWARKDLFEINRGAAREAAALGATIVRSCSGGLMRWDAANPPTEVLLRDTADALRDQETMWRDHGAVLAIETHFEFTSFELLRLFDMCEAEPGGWLGICLDTMNLMTMIEHPVMATRRLLPWVVSTHMKDGGVLSSRDGLVDVSRGPRRGRHRSCRHHPTARHAGAARAPLRGGSRRQLPSADSRRSLHVAIPGSGRRGTPGVARTGRNGAGQPGCRPLDRAEWPGVCESRIAHDLRQLRTLADSVSTFAEASS